MKNFLLSLSLATVVAAIGFPARAEGALEIPFQSPLDTAEDFARWTPYDVDKNVEGEKATWFLGKSDYGGDAAASYTDATAWQETDNWLVSPALSLKAGTNYALKLKYYTSYYNDENFSILLSSSPDPSATHTVVYETTSLRNYYGASLTALLPEIAADGEYYISLRHYSSGREGMCVFIKNLELDVVKEGAVEGTVTNYDYSTSTTLPVEGLKVIFSGPAEYSAVTDADGKYHIDAIVAGDYTVTWNKFGIENESYPRTVTVEAGGTLTHDIRVYKMTTQNVAGTVTDKAGNPLPGATVSLSGYSPYTATTGADGKYRIEGVYLYNGYYDNTYDYEVSKNGFIVQTGNKEVRRDYYGGDSDFGTYALDYNPLAPYSLKATESASALNLAWKRPIDNRLYKYDSGTPDTPLGYDKGIDNILGTVYRTPMNIDGVKWYRMQGTNATDPPATVNILIIDLDENGEPNGEVIYRKDNISSPLNQWSELTFDSPVNAPRGFLLAINTAGYVSIAKDDSAIAPEPRTQLFSNSYEGGYRYFEEVDWVGSLMLRASGERIESGDFTPQVAYSLYRLNSIDAGQPEKWTEMASALTALEYADADFATLPRGTYRYAVKATYAVGDLTSEATLSDEVHKDQHTAVTINVTADSDPADAEGTAVSLNDGAGHTYTASVRNGKVVFDKVWKAVYTLSLKRKGFSAADISADFSNDNAYTHNATIKQDIVPVNNIDVTRQSDGYILSWDIFADINESFDGDDMADFEINPTGELGWSYIDNDRFPTYGFSGHTFPGMNEPMAAVVLNPEATTPAIDRKYARTGKRALGFFAAYPTIIEGGIQLNYSDDYLISPRLDYHKDFKFSFYAKTHESQDGRLETIRVGYSTESSSLDDFTWFDKGYVSVPEEEYTLFSYDVPAAARYVALNNYSDDVFLLLVDDICLSTGITHSGKAPSQGSFNGYTVWLDGVKLGDTNDNLWALGNLADGSHTAEVSKRYNGGESEKLSVTFNAESSMSVSTVSPVAITLKGRKLTISGNYTAASLWTVSGMQVLANITGNDAVDLSGVTPGVYIVRADTADGAPVTVKVVIR